MPRRWQRLAVVMTASTLAACGSSSEDVGPAGGGVASGPQLAAMCSAPDSVMVVAYDLATGAYRWHRCGPGSYHVLTAATSSAVYVRDVSQPDVGVLVLDAASGDERERIPGAEPAGSLPDDAVRPTTGAPEVAGLRVTGGQDDRLVVSDAATGAEVWSAPDVLAYDDVWAGDDQAVYMAHREEGVDAASKWSLRAYDLRTGDIRWETATPAESYPWWVAGGRVFSIWTNLTVLSSETGEVLWATAYDTKDFPGMRGVLANDDTVFVSFASAYGGGD